MHLADARRPCKASYRVHLGTCRAAPVLETWKSFQSDQSGVLLVVGGPNATTGSVSASSMGFTSRERDPYSASIMTDPVLIYTTTTCPYCIRAKRFLSDKGVAYREIDVSHDPEMRQRLVELSGQRTVPQIFIGGKSIGGCDDMIALERRGELDALLLQAFAS